jgi:DNA-3-methyladenine glycosylase I
MHDQFGRRPTSLAGYLEAMTAAILTAGINWRVVEAKWDGIREAFSDFDVQAVAAMGPEDVDRLVEDRRVIRNRRKIGAIIDNAARLLELDAAPGGFAGYLGSRGDFAATVADLRRNFRFLGESTAYWYLVAVGEPVPSHEQCGHTRRPTNASA